MNLWKLEWLRLIRTKRIIALLGVYVFFGFLGPLTARYMGQILENFGGDVQVVFPDPVPADGLTQYIGNAAQVGLLVAVGLAAGALAFDAKPQMGIFLRTRVERLADIITPRYVVITAAVIVAFSLGSLAAFYESWVLIGSLSFGKWLIGTLIDCLFLVFAMALVAMVAARAKSVLSTVMISVGVLLLLPLIGIAPAIEAWVPSYLVGAVDGIVRGDAIADYLPSIGVTLVLTAGALWMAVRWAGEREL